MDRHWNHGASFRVLASAALAGALGWGTAAVAQDQAQATKTMPDAQVEANVLKALAGAPDLANQTITTTTVYGVVTLSGSVQTEALRTEAETIASRSAGVQKVVDEMTLSGEAANAQPMQDSGASPADDQQGTNPDLQSDGTMAPQGQAQPSPNQATGPNYGPGAPEYRQPYGGQQAPPPPNVQSQNGQPQTNYPGGYGPPPGYGQQQQASPGSYGQPPQGYGQPPAGYSAPKAPAFAGQEAGQMVTVPTGALIRIRINQTLESSHSKPGEHFDGIVVSDVVADGAVAIPRGASIQGTVVDAKSSGALSGRGELSLQLTQVTLGGKTYPITSDVWAHNGGDKAVQTVNSTAVGTGIGALFGAAAGGGEGAAIGAGVGAALGLGASAASHRGQVYVPSEGLLTFHIAQPTTVATVSQQEMDRLAQGAGPAAGPQPLQRRYPQAYYGPAYYRPYPYGYPYPYPY
jgi:hypothetical protein